MTEYGSLVTTSESLWSIPKRQLLCEANIYDEVELTVDVKSGFTGRTIQKGTKGVIVECYKEPLEGYAVDVCIPNESFVRGYEYENVILFPDQFALNGSQFVREQGENFSTVALETVETKA